MDRKARVGDQHQGGVESCPKLTAPQLGDDRSRDSRPLNRPQRRDSVRACFSGDFLPG
jgi:hypothetical protein